MHAFYNINDIQIICKNCQSPNIEKHPYLSHSLRCLDCKKEVPTLAEIFKRDIRLQGTIDDLERENKAKQKTELKEKRKQEKLKNERSEN